MSLRFKKKAIKTYSRQRIHSVHNEEPAPKRRRVNSDIQSTTTYELPKSGSPRNPKVSVIALPRSKESVAIFSEEVSNTSTPPSSPLSQPSPHPQPRRPIFSFLKRPAKATASTVKPFAERDHNVQPAPPPQPLKKKRLVQMQIDLGGDTRKSCRVCGMDYIPCNVEDAALHRKFHAMNVGGIDLPRPFAENIKKNKVWDGGDEGFISVIARKDTLAFRNKATQVLDVINTEISAVTIEDDELWGQIGVAEPSTKATDKGKHVSTKNGKLRHSQCDRFKMYLYIRGQKCIGACLAERILEAYSVLERDDASNGNVLPPAGSRSSSISASKTAEGALLGISRIWTSKSHRQNGIATALLDSATSDFLYGMTIPKEMVAFSQPTESGGQLARRWFGRQAGWHVYTD
ncbi:hypothetical protein K432DRAFT_400765 [Lepidopterella palustris CBS 459.81]|uniref:Sister chromatid cohesion acetyltransferase Eco1 n=1 Tax=Lepidopterella palustris CBS 459.81 TaxID=1314670 RepID=A0A8E2JJM9_9PEZI|nr:hypothetical protein K432DRAFT_400765 [Lepidopterella palustris CBS 459.81]